MTADKAKEICLMYGKMIDTDCMPVGEGIVAAPILHVRGMCDRIQGLDGDEVLEWLGFVRGVLFAHDLYTLEELKEHSRPKEVERTQGLEPR